MAKNKKPVAPKPRNPIAEAAWFRSGAGAHGPSKKTQRRQDRAALKKSVREGDHDQRIAA